MPKANVDHTISGQGTAVSTLDHSTTTVHCDTYLPVKITTIIGNDLNTTYLGNDIAVTIIGNDLTTTN